MRLFSFSRSGRGGFSSLLLIAVFCSITLFHSFALADGPPHSWERLKHAVHLIRLYLEDPNAHRDSVGDIRDEIDYLTKEENRPDARKLIDYMIDGSIDDPAENQFHEDLAAVQKLVAQGKGKHRQFRSRVRFDALMGRIGLNSKVDPIQFDYLNKRVEKLVEADARWQEAHKVHSDALQAFKVRYRRLARIGKAVSLVVSGLIGATTYLVGGHFLWGHMPQDVQLTGLAVLSEFSYEKMREYMAHLRDKHARSWLPGEYRELKRTYARLYELNPQRATRFLLAAAAPGEEDEERAKPIEEIATEVLIEHRSPDTTRALIELAINTLKQGDGKKAHALFDEIAARNPSGELGRIWAEVRDTIGESMKAEQVFRNLIRSINLKKAALEIIPAGVVGYFGLQYLDGEKLSSALVIVKDLFVGKVALDLLRKGSGTLTARPRSVAVTRAEEDLVRSLGRLRDIGPHGIRILNALVDNKLPGDTGTLIKQAAERVLEEAVDLQAAHKLSHLGLDEAPSLRPTGVTDAQEKAQAIRERVRQGYCLLDFAKLSAH